jgi:molybdopterin-guanine dinucleotide biosynthesis protein A
MTDLRLSCAILAGGMSRRFGTDKTLAELEGIPLVKRVYDSVSNYSDDIMLIAKDTSKYAFLENVRHLKDISEKQCALVGIITALSYAENDRVFVISADSPLFPFDAVPMMCGYGETVIPEVNGKLYTLAAIYPKNILPILNSAFENNRYRVTEALSAVSITKLPYSAFLPFDRFTKSEIANGFININTQNDLQTAQQLIKEYPFAII